jgi:hypothetical protein
VRFVVAILVAAGCVYTDVNRPIALVVKDLDDSDAANLIEAAKCWNLEFGTHFVWGDAARSEPQQVEVFYDDQQCLTVEPSGDSLGQMQAGWPESIALCPERYWPMFPATPYPLPTPFRILSHELGHVLNIIQHPDDGLAVMRGGGFPETWMFAQADRNSFRDANPEFPVEKACGGVLRSRDEQHGSCSCVQVRVGGE